MAVCQHDKYRLLGDAKRAGDGRTLAGLTDRTNFFFYGLTAVKKLREKCVESGAGMEVSFDGGLLLIQREYFVGSVKKWSLKCKHPVPTYTR